MSYLTDWPSLAQRHQVQTRQILRKLLPNRIRVWSVVGEAEKRYHYEGEAAVSRVFSKLVRFKRFGVPNGIRTRVAGLKGRRPRPG